MWIENISFESNNINEKKSNMESELSKLLNSVKIPDTEKQNYENDSSNLDKQKESEISEVVNTTKTELASLKNEVLVANNIDYSNFEVVKTKTQQALLRKAAELWTLDESEVA